VRLTGMKPQLWILTLIVTTVALAACARDQAAPGGPLLTVVWRGDLCPYGSCSTTFELSADGGYRLTECDGAETFGVIRIDARGRALPCNKRS